MLKCAIWFSAARCTRWRMAAQRTDAAFAMRRVRHSTGATNSPPIAERTAPGNARAGALERTRPSSGRRRSSMPMAAVTSRIL
ncbi:hypothetical protein D3C86_1124020 [compost metagenome]